LALYQFNFQPLAWYVTIGWIAVGLLLYYAVFEKKASVLEPQVLLPNIQSNETDIQPSVIVALHNPDTANVLINLAAPVAMQRNARLIGLSVVDVPRQIPIHEGMRFAHHKEAVLAKAKKLAKEFGVEMQTELVIAHHTSDGILSAAEKHNATALVIGWKGYTNARDRIFGEIADQIIRHAPCDLMVLKIGEKLEMRNCLLPTAGGPNAQLASTILNTVGKHFDMSVTAGYVVSPDSSNRNTQEEMNRIDSTLNNLDSSLKKEKKIIASNSVAGGIAKASRDFDLVVIGAAKEPFFRKILFGEIPEKVARYSPTSVLVVKKYEGVVKSFLKKILG